MVYKMWYVCQEGERREGQWKEVCLASLIQCFCARSDFCDPRLHQSDCRMHFYAFILYVMFTVHVCSAICLVQLVDCTARSWHKHGLQVKSDPPPMGGGLACQTGLCIDGVHFVATQVTRSNKTKWKFHLKNGIVNIRNRDYVFQKANGEAEW